MFATVCRWMSRNVGLLKLSAGESFFANLASCLQISCASKTVLVSSLNYCSKTNCLLFISFYKLSEDGFQILILTWATYLIELLPRRVPADTFGGNRMQSLLIDGSDDPYLEFVYFSGFSHVRDS